MENQAIQRISPLDQGRESPVPTRQAGKEDKGLLSPTQDSLTEKRRAHYGEDPAFEMHSGDSMPDAEFNVNQVPTPNNPTKQDRINPGTESSGDGFFNHFMSG